MDSSLADLDRKGNLDAAPAQYNPCRAFDKVLHFTWSPGDVRYQDRFSPWNIEIVPYGHRGGLGVVRVLVALADAVRYLRRSRIDVVRGRLPYHGSLVGVLAGRMLRIPSVVSLGGDNRLAQQLTGAYQYNSRYLSFAVEALVLRLATRIIVPNRFTADYVARIIGSARARKKVVEIPWRIDLPEDAADDSAVIERLGIRRDRMLAVVVGFVSRYKFADVLFDAIESLATDAQRLQVVFCGDGPLRPEGEARFAQSGAASFVGWQPQAFVRALLRRADFVLVPMSGFVLLEAASLRKPVIAGDVEWHGELVRDGDTGLLVRATDAAAWSSAIRRMLDEPGEAARMGAVLGRRFDAEYHPSIAAARELALYAELTGAA